MGVWALGMLISVVYAPLVFMWAGDGMKSRQGEIRYSPLSLSLSELVKSPSVSLDFVSDRVGYSLFASIYSNQGRILKNPCYKLKPDQDEGLRVN